MNPDSSSDFFLQFKTQSWAEKNGFAHWAVALLWLIAALVLFQLAAGLLFTGLLFVSGEITSIEQLAEAMTQRLDLLFISNSTGQILFIGLATFAIVSLNMEGESRASFLRITWKKNTAFYLILGSLLMIVVQPIVIYLGFLNSLVPLPEFVRELQTAQYEMIEGFLKTDGMIWFALFHVALVPAFCEEFLFRSYVLRAFEKSWGIITAVLVSGLAFGLFHLQIGNLLPLATLGVILAVMTWLSGSIWPAVAAHFVNNGGAIFMVTSFPDIPLGAVTPETLPPAWMLLLSIFLTAGIIIVMMKHTGQKK